MNYTKNDKGEMVIAIGAPGSIERSKVEWPHLIECINAIWVERTGLPGRGIDEAIELIRKRGIKGRLETNSILSASYFADEPEGSVTKMVLSI